MRVTRNQLRQIIQEELSRLKEDNGTTSPPAWAQWIADGYKGSEVTDVATNFEALYKKMYPLKMIYDLTRHGTGQNINDPRLKREDFHNTMDTVANAAAWLRDNAPKD